MKLNIRWSKISIATVAMASVLLAVFIMPLAINRVREYRAALLHPHPVNDAEQSEILRAVLKDEFYITWRLPPGPPGKFASSSLTSSIVLIGSSLAFCNKAPAEGKESAACISPRDAEWATHFVRDEPGIPEKLLSELIASNQVSSTLEDPHIANLLYRPRASIATLLNSTDELSQVGALLPNASYAIEVSRAVLSPDGTHALIYVQLRFIPVGEPGVLYYLVRAGSEWHIEKASGPSII